MLKGRSCDGDFIIIQTNLLKTSLNSKKLLDAKLTWSCHRPDSRPDFGGFGLNELERGKIDRPYFDDLAPLIELLKI
jgi:hypothetical protein